MSPTIWCVRHAQGLHNLSVANHVLQDPVLTVLGEEQCKTLSGVFPNHKTISAIVASPLRRTLYTALLAFRPALEANPRLKVTALSELQETSDVPCDTGSDLKDLQEEVEDMGLRVELRLVQEGWNDKRMGGKWAPNNGAIMERAAEARKWLKDTFRDADGDIVLVSHGGFLHFLTEDWEDSGVYNGKLLRSSTHASSLFKEDLIGPVVPCSKFLVSNVDNAPWRVVLGTGWANTEFRSYSFTNEPEAHLIETGQSRAQREKPIAPPDREAQKAFYAAALRVWENQGLQNPSKAGVEKPINSKPVEARLDVVQPVDS